jgi:hypothetical protein
MPALPAPLTSVAKFSNTTGSPREQRDVNFVLFRPMTPKLKPQSEYEVQRPVAAGLGFFFRLGEAEVGVPG